MVRCLLWTTIALATGPASATAQTTRPADRAPRPKALRFLCDPNWDGRMLSAHRGDLQSGPDNSAAAIAGAARTADTIEIDVQAGADGVHFCFHDGELSRGNCVAPDASWYGRAFRSFTADEIRRLRLPGPKGEPILTFEQALILARKHNACLQLDLKGESNKMADVVIRQCRAAGLERSILVECQAFGTLAYIRKQFPDVATMSRCRDETQVRLSLKMEPTVVQVDDEWASAEIRRLVRSAGVKLLVKTMGRKLDRAEIWQDRYEKGYHLLMTDRPRALRSWLDAHAASPASR